MRHLLRIQYRFGLVLCGFFLAAASVIGAKEVDQSVVWQQIELPLAKEFYAMAPSRERQEIARSFPNLREFAILDPGISTRYNCIAHSLSVHSRWVNPRTGPANNPCVYMDKLYAARGYRRLPRIDFRLQPGVQKLALYATVASGRIREITHAAVQESDGAWTSKLGKLPLIRHLTPQDLNGSSYGRPVATYVRTQRMGKMSAEPPDETLTDLRNVLEGFSFTPPKE